MRHRLPRLSPADIAVFAPPNAGPKRRGTIFIPRRFAAAALPLYIERALYQVLAPLRIKKGRVVGPGGDAAGSRGSSPVTAEAVHARAANAADDDEILSAQDVAALLAGDAGAAAPPRRGEGLFSGGMQSQLQLVYGKHEDDVTAPLLRGGGGVMLAPNRFAHERFAKQTTRHHAGGGSISAGSASSALSAGKTVHDGAGSSAGPPVGVASGTTAAAAAKSGGLPPRLTLGNGLALVQLTLLQEFAAAVHADAADALDRGAGSAEAAGQDDGGLRAAVADGACDGEEEADWPRAQFVLAAGDGVSQFARLSPRSSQGSSFGACSPLQLPSTPLRKVRSEPRELSTLDPGLVAERAGEGLASRMSSLSLASSEEDGFVREEEVDAESMVALCEVQSWTQGQVNNDALMRVLLSAVDQAICAHAAEKYFGGSLSSSQALHAQVVHPTLRVWQKLAANPASQIQLVHREFSPPLPAWLVGPAASALTCHVASSYSEACIAKAWRVCPGGAGEGGQGGPGKVIALRVSSKGLALDSRSSRLGEAWHQGWLAADNVSGDGGERELCVSVCANVHDSAERVAAGGGVLGGAVESGEGADPHAKAVKDRGTVGGRVIPCIGTSDAATLRSGHAEDTGLMLTQVLASSLLVTACARRSHAPGEMRVHDCTVGRATTAEARVLAADMVSAADSDRV